MTMKAKDEVVPLVTMWDRAVSATLSQAPNQHRTCYSEAQHTDHPEMVVQ